ncbi:MAG TPA: radical SAM protein [Gemmataceae bacterium]|nr:radical SAM protein [Gemmataceae bacterium]
MNRAKAQEYLVKRIHPAGNYEELLSFPRYFEIETINACNARCPMCTIDDWQRNTPTIKDDLFQKISDELIANAKEVNRVCLYRDGEPLLDKKLARRVQTLKDGGIRSVNISTNVALLNERWAKSLLEAGLDEVLLSIDSLKKDVYEAIRVRLNFEQVMENALKFIEMRNRIRPETTIILRMIRQESNFHEWPAYYEYWKPKLAAHDRVYYSDIHNWGGQLQQFKPVSMSYQPFLPCVALWSLMIIFANGDVPLCSVDYNNKFPLGNVRDQSIRDLWQSQLAHLRRESHLSGNKGDVSICKECTAWNDASDRENYSRIYVDDGRLGLVTIPAESN